MVQSLADKQHLPKLRASGAVHLIGICLRPPVEEAYTPSSSSLDIPKSLIFTRLFSPTRQFLAARSLWIEREREIGAGVVSEDVRRSREGECCRDRYTNRE